MYKIQFQIKIFSEFCEDPRGHINFFQICRLLYNLWIIAIIHGLLHNPQIIGQNVK